MSAADLAHHLSAMHEEMAADNRKADEIEWSRFRAFVEDMLDKYGEENVRGLVDLIMEERQAEAEEARELAEAEREKRDQFHLRKYGHYPRSGGE